MRRDGRRNGGRSGIGIPFCRAPFPLRCVGARNGGHSEKQPHHATFQQSNKGDAYQNPNTCEKATTTPREPRQNGLQSITLAWSLCEFVFWDRMDLRGK